MSWEESWETSAQRYVRPAEEDEENAEEADDWEAVADDWENAAVPSAGGATGGGGGSEEPADDWETAEPGKSPPQSPPLKPSGEAPKEAPKPKKPKEHKEKKDKKKEKEEEKVDADTQRRRLQLIQKINDFNAAQELFGGDSDMTVVPIAHMKPKSRGEYEQYADSIAEVLKMFSDDPHYVPFLLEILKNLTVKHEQYDKLSSKLSVLANERSKVERPTGAALMDKKRRYGTKKATDMDVGLSTRGGAAGSVHKPEDDLDFM